MLRRDRPVAAGMVFPAAGEKRWQRPSKREVMATRNGPSGFATSPRSGKIDVQGPDAGDVPRPALRQPVCKAGRWAARATA